MKAAAAWAGLGEGATPSPKAKDGLVGRFKRRPYVAEGEGRGKETTLDLVRSRKAGKVMLASLAKKKERNKGGEAKERECHHHGSKKSSFATGGGGGN